MNKVAIYEDGRCFVNDVEVGIRDYELVDALGEVPMMRITLPVVEYSVRNSVGVGLDDLEDAE